MAEFRYFTRGDSSPQGKQKVYFTAHPDDYKLYFEEIRDDILERQNCAVFYLDGDTQPDEVEDCELRLREMQLFVVPVTTKLLTTPNRAMDIEVPFAIRNHIPVLPLMQESGLDELFGKKDRFGDLQYLDKHNTDPTVIPYDEKLTKYLESILVGDELAKQIRDAFDAYIFLSYRKKDRKYAQELMRIIHENPFCRDIAIWYDEFLTPGEDFNNAIKTALKKSGLFALAVTPNLLEMPDGKPNFVMDKEYPAAKEEGKEIFPAEMQPTDRALLGEMYDGIPEPVSAENKEALTARLDDAVQKIAKKENDKDPRHNFFIGLAYLGGIDVELNHGRAVELITGSAEADYIPAIEKLVSMHSNGEGVERDYNKAVQWQEKLVEQRKKAYDAKPDKDTALDLLNALWRLGDAYKDLGQLSSALKAYEEMCGYAENFAKEYKTDTMIRYQGLSYSFCGDMEAKQGRLAEAEKLYRKAIQRITSVAIRDLLVFKNDLKNQHRQADRRRPLTAEKKEDREELDRQAYLKHQRAETEYPHDLSALYIKLGDIAAERENNDKAEEWYKKSLDILEGAAKENESERIRIELCLNCQRLGKAAAAKEDYTEASEWFKKSLDIAEPLAEANKSPAIRTHLLMCYIGLGYICLVDPLIYDDCITNKTSIRKKALDLAEELAAEINTAEARFNLSTVYEQLGLLNCSAGFIGEGKEWFAKCIEIRQALTDETGMLDHYDSLARAYADLGMMTSDRAMIKKGIAIWNELAEKKPENALYRRYSDMLRKQMRSTQFLIETIKSKFRNSDKK